MLLAWQVKAEPTPKGRPADNSLKKPLEKSRGFKFDGSLSWIFGMFPQEDFIDV
jgi:hypothetical protein